ncbi:MAG: 2,3,4,5-tetrahydropyridine-2,6-dicarboxylate N-succinyltransferase [Silvanigrellaceae bacterium]|nr:2,3,4,5-tetrahydropyridine-2,6-dicarboxylate N-succinyltransferase [Silvanigrellaceae bacterium]
MSLIEPIELKDLEQQILAASSVSSEILQQDLKLQEAIVRCLRYLEQGKIRVISPENLDANCGSVSLAGDLQSLNIHPWVKQSILLAMRWRSVKAMHLPFAHEQPPSQGRIHASSLSYCDKFDVRSDLYQSHVRVVPNAIVREGAYVAPGVILMPSFVNIGAWVGEGTLVDTWATVGSCAQIGNNVHLSGGVGIGGVLEPVSASPVVVGDNAFIGSRSILVEGIRVGSGAVLAANVCITASTPIYDMTRDKVTEYRGFVPPNAVVAPGTRAKKFPGGEVNLQCAYIISYRNEKTDAKVSLNQILRETGIPV